MGKRNPKLIVAGGGTGGHVLAGIAVADEWIKKTNSRDSVLFIGSKQGLESKLVPKYGYALQLLKIGALNKVSFKTRLITLIQIPFSLIMATIWVIKFRPSAVLGVGGYASGPVVLIAKLLSFIFPIRTAILEQNSVTGFTNRLLGKWVHRVFCAFEQKGSFETEKILITGNPIRSTLTRLPPAQTDPFTLFIFGGSQGAIGVNTMIIEALPFLKTHGVKFIHQTGVKDFERVKAAYAREGVGDAQARIEKFIDQMNECYQAASIVICRAGASSMSELASVGRAAIFIPLPTAADNHQEKNARIFEQNGASWVIKQASMTGAQFADFILNIKNSPEKIQKVEQAVQKFYRSDSAQVMVNDLLGKV